MGQAYVDELGHGNAYVHLGTYDVNIDEPDTIAPVLVTLIVYVLGVIVLGVIVLAMCTLRLTGARCRSNPK